MLMMKLGTHRKNLTLLHMGPGDRASRLMNRARLPATSSVRRRKQDSRHLKPLGLT